MRALSYLGLGSNLEQPRHQLRQALAALQAHPDIELLRCSRFYGSQAVGPGDQPDYVNAVAAITTLLAPQSLLSVLQAIENDQGRQRQQHWGPRTLDLDILLYGDWVVEHPDLQIPHPRLRERAFVVVPLLEIAPELCLPDGTSLRGLLDYVGADTVWPLQPQDGV